MKKYIIFLLLVPVLFFGQSQSQNYIKTTTYKQAGLSTIATPTSSQAQVDVTYFDGLGRPIEQIAKEQSNSGNDIITPITYDYVGRQTEDYLPYASTQKTAAYIDPATVITSLITQYKTTYGAINDNPFSKKDFENSPLNRVLQQAAPGNDWSMAKNHTVKFDYQSNVANEVKQFNITLTLANNTYTPILINSSYYLASQLYKTITKDENWVLADGKNNTTEEFKDKQGNVILKKTFANYDLNKNGAIETSEKEIAHETYYVYDNYGNLTYVLPPKMDATTTTIATINSKLNDLGYQYKYDNRNRLVEKKLPGKQWEFIVYDKLDRVVATGPALSPFKDSPALVIGWIITKYDAFSRPIYTGWEQSTTVTSAGRVTKQTDINAQTQLSEIKTTIATTTVDPTITGTLYYSNAVLPTTFKLLTVNYYDSYIFPTGSTIVIPTSVVGQITLTTSQVKGLPTTSWTRVLTTLASASGETTATIYDAKARPIGTYIQNYLDGYTRTDTKLDFSGKPEYTITCHKRVEGDTELKSKDVFTYSPEGRLVIHTNQITKGTYIGPTETIVSNTYDDLGQLISKSVGNTASYPLQKVNFAYNIRGWMTEINKIDNLTQGTVSVENPKDLFAFKINYNTTTTGITGVKALYNGNIAETFWNTSDQKRAYGYKYDNINRLTDAVYQKAATTAPFMFSTTNAYNENITYDKNGNIMSLSRNGGNEATATQMDDLVYSYGTSNSTNQLTKVADSSSKTLGFVDTATNTVDDYSYDLNGNMTIDKNKGIVNGTLGAITYNHLNLPTKIIFGTKGNITYIYNAAGQKVQKLVVEAGKPNVITDYLGEYQYKTDATPTSLQFLPTAEGYVEPSGSSYKYVYQYKDHLGNVRLSYNNVGSIPVPNLQVLEENSYYPFGLKHTSTVTPIIVSTNQALKYKYNGKELQDELGLNMYDFGARNYDPAIGRWMNIDPMANKTVDYSPYNFVLNNPLSFIDPDGLYPKPVLIYNQATNSYRFTNAASHLLSLVSGVDKRQIQNTVINERGYGRYVPFYSANEGGGAITLGSPNYYTITYTQNFFEDDSSKYNGNGFGQDIYTWLSHSSHEVGHISQIKKEGSSLSYLGEFISQYSTSGNHDGADYEKEADKGSDLFGQFNNFVDKTYGRNSLVNLFENHTDPVIVKRLDKWWGAFEKDRGKKEERTNSFMQGLNTSLDNYSEGTYIYDGNNWVKKN